MSFILSIIHSLIKYEIRNISPTMLQNVTIEILYKDNEEYHGHKIYMMKDWMELHLWEVYEEHCRI